MQRGSCACGIVRYELDARCGSPVPSVNEELNYVAVPAGTADGTTHLAPAAHFYVDFKADWFTIGDDAPQFATVPEGGVVGFLLERARGRRDE
jgi:hypothetical protein